MVADSDRASERRICQSPISKIKHVTASIMNEFSGTF